MPEALGRVVKCSRVRIHGQLTGSVHDLAVGNPVFLEIARPPDPFTGRKGREEQVVDVLRSVKYLDSHCRRREGKVSVFYVVDDLSQGEHQARNIVCTEIASSPP